MNAVSNCDQTRPAGTVISLEEKERALTMAKVIRMNTRVCDKFAPSHIAPAQQREIAALAYKLWLARSFRNGSPQEDWLQAQLAVCQQRRRA
jgi:hypothetical protein